MNNIENVYNHFYEMGKVAAYTKWAAPRPQPFPPLLEPATIPGVTDFSQMASTPQSTGTTSVPPVVAKTQTAPQSKNSPTTTAKPTAFSINKGRGMVNKGTSYSQIAKQMGGNVTARQLQDYAKKNLGGSFQAGRNYDFDSIRQGLMQQQTPNASPQVTNMLGNLRKARANKLTIPQSNGRSGLSAFDDGSF
jgi:hypothetical protein